MSYRGTIIKESLSQDINLEEYGATVIETRVERVTESHQTPWLNKWTLTTFEVSDEKAGRLAEDLAAALLSEPGTWYADFKDPKKHYIVFPDKVFHIDRTEEEYKKVKQYGLTLGIPGYQLDFSPEIL